MIIMVASEAWILLNSGDVIGAVISALITPMGFWMFILLLAGVNTMVYLKTDSVTSPLIINLMASSMMLWFAPVGASGVTEMMIISRALFVISVAGIIWKIWKGR